MEPNTQPNNSPMNNTMPSGAPVNAMPNIPMQNVPHNNKSSIGSIIGTIIVIAIIILGGLYFWGKRIDEARIKEGLVSNTNTTEEVVSDENMEANAIMSVTKSDDLGSIEADLEGTNLNNLGSELNVVAQ